MSHFLTPPEPVAWGSRQMAAKLETISSIQPLPLRRSFKRLVWMFWLLIQHVIITLGWPHSRSKISPKTNQIFLARQKFYPVRSRVGYSYRQYIHKLPLLYLLNLGCLLIFVQVARAESPDANRPTRLMIPAIGLDSPVVPVGWKKVEVDGQTYGQWNVDDNLVGWHNLSAPLGQAGNSVFNGHSNIHAQVFRDLDQLEIGDVIVAYANDQTYHYVVATKILVQEKGVSLEQRLENAKLILPSKDERLTLITCAQAGATHRLIIIALPEYSYSQ